MTTSTVKAERQHTEASKPEIDNDNFNLAKKSSENLFKILCVGDFSGGWSKGVYIEDYLRSDGTTCENAIEKPVIGFSLSLRTVTCKRSGEKIRLHMWNIAEQERFSTISKIYYKMADGALVFWGAKSRSFESAIKWKANVSQTLQLDIPFVLVVDNVFKTPAKWIGQGLVINSPDEMDQFCLEHGFLAWFEMLERAGGEDSVFGQAMNTLIDEIFSRKNPKQTNTLV